MEDYLDTQVSAEQEDVVGSPADDPSENQQEGGNGQPVAGAGADDNADRENNRMAAARRSGDRAGYSRAQKEADEKIAVYGRVDPRTGKKISSVDDVLSFLKGQEDEEIAAEASRTKRSAEDIRREREAKRIGERQMEAERQKEDEKKYFQRDAADFIDVYGKETFDKLMKDEDFADYADGKIGKRPLTDIFERYQRLSGKAERVGREKREDKAARSTGSGSGTGANNGLSTSEKAALDNWNQRYPNMKMTEAEWKKR